MQPALRYWIWHNKSCVMFSTWSSKVLTCRVSKLVSSLTFTFSSCPPPSTCGVEVKSFFGLVATIFPMVVGMKGPFVILIWGSVLSPVARTTFVASLLRFVYIRWHLWSFIWHFYIVKLLLKVISKEWQSNWDIKEQSAANSFLRLGLIASHLFSDNS